MQADATERRPFSVPKRMGGKLKKSEIQKFRLF